MQLSLSSPHEHTLQHIIHERVRQQDSAQINPILYHAVHHYHSPQTTTLCDYISFRKKQNRLKASICNSSKSIS